MRLVKAIYIMYKLWLISPLGWQRPRQAQVPWPGWRVGVTGAPEGKGGLSNTFLALKGGGEEVPMAPPDTKTWREFFK